ncbi:MAG: Hint domain-containing protein, partial [Chloroflexota bacterium]
ACLVLVVAAACGGGSAATTPGATAGPGATTEAPSPALTLPELKFAIIGRFGALWYCDPDFYPVARTEELAVALERWPEVVAEREAFAALTATFGLDPSAAFSDAQKLDVYRGWKVLNAIALDPASSDAWRFDYLAQPAGGAAEGTRTTGSISSRGEIKIATQVAAGQPMCPICLARGTMLETPLGAVAVQDLGLGDPVWTLDLTGNRVPGTVIAFGSTAAPANHHVVRLVLVDGRTVTASPGHPLADGRLLGDLRIGDPVDGSAVRSAELLAYTGGHTFDIVVSGPTGTYLVDGIALGSTLQP